MSAEARKAPGEAWVLGPASELIDEAACWRRIGQAEVGRLAFLAGGTIRVYPVAYAVRRGRVFVRTSPYSELATRPDGPTSFQVDQFDTETREAWSVLVTGRLVPVTDPYETASAWAAQALRPWVDGWRDHTLRLDPETVSGIVVHGAGAPPV
ncbi:pyridoxamine 5'-phosphate oxidase family protein [Mumia sp. DW29H23]|uniref:pyridoxamine 5'-phosphate oxidase family protein n=1 Tax=Mumia sp. DW29H23 TaxID=3421241 RepID=UPI003D686FB7